MAIFKIIWAILIMTVIPIGMGFVYPSGRRHPGRALVSGLITMWAVTFVFALPLILLEKTLTLLIWCAVPAWGIIFLAGLAAYVLEAKRGGFRREAVKLSRPEVVFLGIFLGLVAFQLYKSLFYAYADGDDTYYVATSQLSAISDMMYRYDPYTGIYYVQPKRYFMAPFPMWIAMITRLTGLNAATVAHVAAPVSLIPVTYVIYNEIGKVFFKDKREGRYIFLCFIAVFVIFSGFSISSPERFMLTRTRQGKEALGNIIIPLAMLYMTDILDEEKGMSLENLLLMWALGLAGSLTSFFANLLLGIAGATLFVYFLVKRKGVKALSFTAAAMIPEVAMMLLYMIL